MRVVRYKLGEKPKCMPRAIALGFFDGVHLGHRALIADTIEMAEREGTSATVFTFPSDAALKRGAARLYSTEDKLKIFETLGVDEVVLCDFGSVSALSPGDFIEKVLIEALDCRSAVVGEDFRFGHRAEGTSVYLRDVMTEAGRSVKVHEMLLSDIKGRGRVEISATLIRELLSLGEVSLAAELLGAPYFISGTVERGRGDGHGLGYPTVNTKIGESPLKHGVYHTRVRVGGEEFQALTNVGICPTFSPREPHLETHILDFSREVYGERVFVEFLDFLREEMSFSSGEELTQEIEKNIKQVLGEI